MDQGAKDVRASVVIATFGSERWRELAMLRAYPAAKEQGCEVILHHDAEASGIHEARNAAAAKASGEWLVFCDADDELEPGYVDAILRTSARAGDLRYPRVRYLDADKVCRGKLPEPTTLMEKHLFAGNYMVIGTGVRRELFFEVGGFDLWESWEDWALWIKCWLAGAKPVLVPDAVYRCYRTETGRCWTFTNARALHDTIVRHYRPQARALGLA